MPQSLSRAELEDSLRRVLREESGLAPMPLGLMDVPVDWVRPRGMFDLDVAIRVAAVTGVVGGGIVVAGLLSRSGMLSPALTLDDAARVAGLSADRMVTTVDGFVGVGGPSPDSQQVRLVFVPSDGQAPRTLAVQDVPGFGIHEPPGTMVSDVVSCSSSAGLLQADFIFGYVESYAPLDGGVYAGLGGPLTALWTEPELGQGTVVDGSFVYVFDEPPTTAFDVRMAGGSAPGNWESVIPFGLPKAPAVQLMFDHAAPCGAPE